MFAFLISNCFFTTQRESCDTGSAPFQLCLVHPRLTSNFLANYCTRACLATCGATFRPLCSCYLCTGLPASATEMQAGARCKLALVQLPADVLRHALLHVALPHVASSSSGCCRLTEVNVIGIATLLLRRVGVSIYCSVSLGNHLHSLLHVRESCLAGLRLRGSKEPRSLASQHSWPGKPQVAQHLDMIVGCILRLRKSC